MRTPRALFLTLQLAGGCALSFPRVAAAQSAADPATAKKATDLFRAGRAAAAAGDDKTACARFAESEALVPAPGTQLNLGACESKQGHLLAAREHFRKAGALFKPDDIRRAVAINSANDITDKLAVLTVHLAPGAPQGAQVTLDGAPLDPPVLERGLELEPGRTTLVVNAEGRQPREYPVTLKEGEKRDLVVDVGEVPSPPVVAGAPPPATTDDGGPSRRKLMHTLGYVGLGAGAGGILLGSIFGGLAFHQASLVKANCTASYECRPAGVAAASSGSTDGAVSTASFVLGGVFLAAGAYLTYTTWKDPNGAAPASALVVSPELVPGGGGASAAWTF
jgi:hypothetical protein